MNLDRALNYTLPLVFDGQVPDWVQILPAGPAVQGEDGRSWSLSRPEAVLASLRQRKNPLVIDWEHASEHRAPNGLDAPAAGWVDQYELRNGELYAHVQWTARAAQQIGDGEYRFLSPVLLYRTTDREIVGITSVALTNTPNLSLKALNREESPMTLPAALCSALGLPETASETDAVTTASAMRQRIDTLNAELATANNRANSPSPEQFVPRAELTAVLARATNAEQQLNTLQAAQRESRVTTLIDKALADGQIIPATQDYYKAMCATEAGVVAFEAFLAKAPKIVGGSSTLDATPPPKSGAATALTDSQKALCQNMGIAPADYLKHLNKEAA